MARAVMIPRIFVVVVVVLIVSAVAFLASSDADFITGVILDVTGGD